MFGGVADKYRLYKQIGEPFKEGKSYYIMVQAPFGKSDPIKVRFYTDKAHGVSNSKNKPLYKIFGFNNENDSILIIKEKDLSQEEIEEFFNYNWEKGGNWKAMDLDGITWYAPLSAKIPPIVHTEKIFKCDWSTFKTLNKEHCLANGASKDCIWLKEN